MRIHRAFILLVAAGCSSTQPSSIDSTAEPMFTARVTGAVISDFRGTAFFQMAGYAGSHNVTILAHERVLPAGDMLVLAWFGSDREMPTKGTHELGTPELASSAGSGFYALYHTPKGSTQQSFVSHGGSLTLTASDMSRIAGSFRFHAQRYCVYDGQHCTPSDATPTSPEVTLEGSFVAPPMRTIQ